MVSNKYMCRLIPLRNKPKLPIAKAFFLDFASKNNDSRELLIISPGIRSRDIELVQRAW